jgi:hypothetical protein
MTGESFKALSEFKGLNDLPEQYRKEIDHSLKYDPYRSPKTPPKFTREQVLEYIRALPNTREEMENCFQEAERMGGTAPRDAAAPERRKRRSH